MRGGVVVVVVVAQAEMSRGAVLVVGVNLK
jgi:hypothetical protein